MRLRLGCGWVRWRPHPSIIDCIWARLLDKKVTQLVATKVGAGVSGGAGCVGG